MLTQGPNKIQMSRFEDFKHVTRSVELTRYELKIMRRSYWNTGETRYNTILIHFRNTIQDILYAAFMDVLGLVDSYWHRHFQVVWIEEPECDQDRFGPLQKPDHDAFDTDPDV